MSYAPRVYKTNGGDKMVVADGGTIQVESGGTLVLDSGAIATFADEILAGADIAIADGKILIGDVNGAGAAKTLSGDVTMTREGVTAIGAKKVVGTMISLADGKILIGDADADAAAVTPTGDVTITNTGVTAIGAGKVTLAMMANLATDTFIARDTAGTGVPEAVSAAAALTMLGATAGVAAGYKIARGVSSITGSGTVVTGLATVVSVIATAASDLDGDALASVSASIGDQAGAPAAGSVYLKAWKVTTGGAAGNPTLIAATAAKDINWIAIGT